MVVLPATLIIAAVYALTAREFERLADQFDLFLHRSAIRRCRARELEGIRSVPLAANRPAGRSGRLQDYRGTDPGLW